MNRYNLLISLISAVFVLSSCASDNRNVSDLLVSDKSESVITEREAANTNEALEETVSQNADNSDVESITEAAEDLLPADSTDAKQSGDIEEEEAVPNDSQGIVIENRKEKAVAKADENVYDEENSAEKDAGNQLETPRVLSAKTSDELDAEAMEIHMLALINAEREENQIEALGMEETMQWAARIRAEEIQGGLSHTRPDNTPYHTAFYEAGFSYAGKWHGENLANLSFSSGKYTEEKAAEMIFNGLKESPGHYQNMINDNFLQAGIGVNIVVEGQITHITTAHLFSSGPELGEYEEEAGE